MKLRFFTIVVAGLLLGACPSDKHPTDEARLQGSWTLQSLQIDMHQFDVVSLDGDQLPALARLVIRGNQYTANIGNGFLEMTYQLYPETSPRAIDLTFAGGRDKGKSFRGIYKLEGNLLTVCRPTEPRKERPQAFAVKPGSHLMMTVWKREKPRRTESK